MEAISLAQWAILREHGDLDALVTIQQSQCKIDILLDNLINDLSSGCLWYMMYTVYLECNSSDWYSADSLGRVESYWIIYKIQ